MSKAAELAKMGEVLTNSQVGGRRNIVINGAMQVSQRGTSSASVTSAAYLVDRFQANISSLGTWTLSQSTTTPDGFTNSFKMDCTTANASPASGAFLNCRQKIEAQDLQQLKYGTSSAETLTVSFHVRSNKTGTYIVELLQPDASNRHRGASYTINSANTWEKKIVTFSGDTSGVINNDTGDGIQLTWWLGSGSDFNSGTLQTDWGALDQTARAVGNVNLADSTDNEWYITGVQLEVGSTETPFEHRSFGEEEALCMRYYQRVIDGSLSITNNAAQTMVNMAAYSASSVFGVMPLTVRMRDQPTIDITTGTGYYTFLRNGTNDPFDSFSFVRSQNDRVEVYVASGLSHTVGHAGWIRSNSASAYIAADAEL